MLLGGCWLGVVGLGLWVVGCGFWVVGLEVRNQWVIEGFSLLVTMQNTNFAPGELFYFPVFVLIQKDIGKCCCNYLIIIRLQKHSFYTVITMLLRCNIYVIRR